MTWREKIDAAHAAVTDAVSHYYAIKRERYIVWAEERPRDLVAEGRHAERAVRGTSDLFTKQEDDPWAAQLEAAYEAQGIAWYRNSTQYEPDTGFIHIEWVWEATDGAPAPPEPPEPEPDETEREADA